jgi:hypothetical protein
VAILNAGVACPRRSLTTLIGTPAFNNNVARVWLAELGEDVKFDVASVAVPGIGPEREPLRG